MDDRPNSSPARAVPLTDAKARLSELVDRAAAGEEITITRHGVPVARLAPPRAAQSEAERRKILERWRARERVGNLRGTSIRALIAEGRR